MKIKQPADLENALKQPLTPTFAVSLLKRFLKELPEQLIPTEQSSAIFKVINESGKTIDIFSSLSFLFISQGPMQIVSMIFVISFKNYRKPIAIQFVYYFFIFMI